MKKKIFMACTALPSLLFGQTQIDTFYYTGAEQTWVVPQCASNIVITTIGAQGASGSTVNPGINVGGSAGLGNRVTAAFTSAPGTTFYINVGGQANGGLGGFNGGGNGAMVPPANPAGGGGGASDVRFPTNSLTDRVIVAGGGGGGGNAGFEAGGLAITNGDGGNGGGNQVLYGNSLDGSNGDEIQDGTLTYLGANGGTSVAAGANGIGCSGFLGMSGASANQNIGGNGGNGNNGFGNYVAIMAAGGGAGGGGYVGGNGGGGGSFGTTGCQGNGSGSGGGGSAGSNYSSGSNFTFTNGVQTGNGLVIVHYDLVTVLNTTTVSGETITASESGATYQWYDCNLNSPVSGATSQSYTPTATGNFAVIVSNGNCSDTSDCIQLTIGGGSNVGIDDIASSKVLLFPNPASSSFTISGLSTNNSIELIDMTGKVVATKNATQGEIKMDVNDFNKGVYFVQIKENGVILTTKKLIINN